MGGLTYHHGMGGSVGGGGGGGSSSVYASALANAPNCQCGEKAICLKTMKEGENKGREFYACSKRR